MVGKSILTKEAPASSAGAKSTWVMPVIQVFLIVAGLAGLAFQAFPVRTNQYYDNWPLFDLTALAWLVPIVVAMLLPNISEVTWGPLSLKVRELKSASEVYEVSLDNLANLVQNWSTSAAMYIAKMGQREENLLEAKDAIYADYVRDRMGEAYEMAGFFDYVAEQVAQGLASQCALAVKVYEDSQAAASTSSRDEPVPEPGSS
jgi:hypothetical protein